MVIEAGRSALSPNDLSALEAEDIILMEQTELTLEGDALGGWVQCRFGKGAHGYLKSALLLGRTGDYEIRIEKIVPLDIPEAHHGQAQDEAAYSLRVAPSFFEHNDTWMKKIHRNQRSVLMTSTATPLLCDSPNEPEQEVIEFMENEMPENDDPNTQQVADGFDDNLEETGQILEDIVLKHQN